MSASSNPVQPDLPLAVVTGASSGLGEHIARRLSKEGFGLVLVARRAERLDALAAELGNATTVAVDLVDDAAPAAILAEVEERGGTLDLLVNNAGFGGRGEFGDTGYEGVRATMEVNFDAQLRVTEALLPILRESEPSTIVNVSSVSGRIARPGAGAYSASKFALAGWTEALRAEEKPRGVHVALLLPGYISTEGFPQTELLEHRWMKHLVAGPDHAADAVVEAYTKKRDELYVPKAWRIANVMRTLTPGLMARFVSNPEATPGATER